MAPLHAALLLIAFLAGAANPWIACAQTPPARKVALVIGNAAYRESPLLNPVNDARAMAAKLRELGYRVIAEEDATKTRMERALVEFGEALEPAATAMFYYAGHGLQVNGRNFLVPVDATMASEQRLRLETLDVDIVLDQMETAKTSVNFVVLDACRNNPFERRVRATGSGLAQINAPRGTLLAYATAPGKVASDGAGANGVYTSRLLQHIATPGLQVEEVFKRVRVDVARDTAGAQTPWEASSLTAPHFFLAPAAAAPAAAVGLTPEQALWDAVRNSANHAMFQGYLELYPNGANAEAAKARLAALRPPPAAPATPPAAPGPAAAPAQQAAAAVPPPASSPSGTRDGRWRGGSRAWTVDLTVKGDAIEGKARVSSRPGEMALTGRIAEDGSITGFVDAPPTMRFDLFIGGQFPELQITGGGGVGAQMVLIRAP